MRLTLFIVLALNSQLSYSDIDTGLGGNLFAHQCQYFWRFPDQNFTRNELVETNFNGKKCKAVELVYVGRHGARFPEDGEFDRFEELRNKILNNSVNLDPKFDFIRTWKDWPNSLEGITEYSGRSELIKLGNMYGNALFDLFKGKFSPETVKISGSHYTRVLESAADFYIGLTETVTGNPKNDITPVANDHVNQFFANCPNYLYGVQQNKTHMQEKYKFRNSSYALRVIEEVSARLGMNISLDFYDLVNMFALCSTELESRNNTDWCSLQTEEEREIINYAHDLGDYYDLMYGHPLIPKMACPMWEDIFGSFSKAIEKYDNNQTYLIGDLHFGHSHTLNPFLTSIGLFRDKEPLRADNFEEMRNRSFYASKVMPSGGHVAFILYNCGGEGPENYVLKMVVNGQPMYIPRCGSDTCPYLVVEYLYNEYINNCQWDKYCTAENPLEG